MTNNDFTLEPETRAYVDAEARRPPTEGQSIDQIREVYVASLKRTSVAPDPGVVARALDIQGPNGVMPARLYTPPAAQGQISGLLLYVHGGGFAAGDLDSHDGLLRLVARHLGHRVLAIHYARAPEHRFPSARDNVLAAFAYAQAHAADLQIDATRIAIGGESAGGAHAAAAAIALSQTGGVQPRALWMFVPALDATTSGDSYTQVATGAGRTAAEFSFLWSLYTPPGLPPADPGLSPLYADLSRLPETFVFTAEFDPARSDGESFAAKAEAAGVQVRLMRQVGLIHQFPEITGVSAKSREAVVGATGLLKAALDRTP